MSAADIKTRNDWVKGLYSFILSSKGGIKNEEIILKRKVTEMIGIELYMHKA